MQIKKLIVHMDNSPCVRLINEDQLMSNSLKFIVSKCKELIGETHWVVKLEHTYREANRAADNLANQGVYASTIPSYLDSPTNSLRSILREDIFGVAIPRVIASS